jgi:nucleotide-binding universal stress UspA family protein
MLFLRAKVGGPEVETVVVGLDETPAHHESLRWAADYCRLNGDELVGVVPYRSPQSETPPDWYEQDVAMVRKQAEAELDAVAPDVPWRVEVLEGEPTAVIPMVARGDRAAVVVIGSHANGAFPGLGLGSVAHHLSRHLVLPLVIVSDMGGPLHGSPVVVGLDGSRSDLVTLEWALYLAEGVGGSVTVVYATDPMAASYPHPRGATVADEKEEVVRDQVAWAATPGVEISLKVELDDPVTALTRVADQVNGSVIVIGRKGAGRLRGVLLGRVPAHLPNHAHRPVAIVPRRATD